MKMRVERLENILIEVALHKNRCKYICVSDLKKVLLNKRLVREKKCFVKLSEGRANVEPDQVRQVSSIEELNKAEFSDVKEKE